MKICLLNWKEIRRDLVAEIRSFVRRPLVCERRWLKPFYSCYHPLRDSSTFLQIHFESDLNPPEVLRHCACVVKTIFQKSTDVWKFNLRCEKNPLVENTWPFLAEVQDSCVVWNKMKRAVHTVSVITTLWGTTRDLQQGRTNRKKLQTEREVRPEPTRSNRRTGTRALENTWMSS